MTLSLEALRELLVDRWCIVSSKHFLALHHRFPDPTQLTNYLLRKVRFRRFQDNVEYLTPDLHQALLAGNLDEPIFLLNGNRWLKLRSLGGGAQGRVWAACPCDAAATADQLVALKTPKPASSPAEERSRLLHLQHEIDILGRINSDFIACLIDADRATGTIATRLVEGPTLEQRVEDERRLSVALTVGIGIDVCRALQALHALGWIHKDVKPLNLIHEKGQRAVMIDFGLAQDPSCSPPTREGTSYYMAPEVFTPLAPHDVRADVYSLAATLFRFLAGRPPHFQQCIAPRRFKSSRAQLEVLRFQLADAALDCDLADFRHDVPRQLSQLLCEALSVDLDLRPRTADDFRVALEAIQAKFEEAKRIEDELWKLSTILLTAFRSVYSDAEYPGKEIANATQIVGDLNRALGHFPALSQLRATSDTWTGIAAAYAAVPPTVKILTQMEALTRQLRVFLARTIDPSKLAERTELLKELVVRTLEGIRSASMAAIAAAHAWRSVLQHLGVE